MAVPDTQPNTTISENEVASPNTTVLDQDDSRALSALFDAALKDVFITVGTIWFIATLVAIGAFALGLQLIAAIAALVVVTMMFAWLAGISFLVAGWVTKRFDIIAVLTGGRTGTGTPGQRQRN